MYSKLFVDTSYVLALFTTEAILLEVGNSFSGTAYRRKCVKFIRGFYSTKNIVIEPVTTDIIKEALSFFEKRLDKEWGLVDCISFLVMKKHGVKSALSADDHFIQAGFRALLLE